jgi:two-component system, OmpR family, alkaline phosphatase synthesis response regulator PhoP
MGRILIVEDNADLAEGIAFNLKLEGHETLIVSDGAKAPDAFQAFAPDLVLLDLMLPGMDGYEVLRSIRGSVPRVPVIILSARAEEADKVRGFKLDADQYVTKPFGILELIERIASQIRRSRGPSVNGSQYTISDVEVDTDRRVVHKAGREVPLSPKAYELLLALVRRRGAVASRNDLLREVWGYGAFVVSRTVDTHIAELRRKLEDDAADPKIVMTVWKVGYRIDWDLSSSDPAK